MFAVLFLFSLHLFSFGVSFRVPCRCRPECSVISGRVLMSLAEPCSLSRTEEISFVATFLLFMTSVQFVYYKMIYI